MLEVLGRGYVVDCCIAAANRKRERENFEYYITDAALAIISMFAKDVHYPRYYDILHPAPEETRTGEEIAADILKRHGLTVVS